MGTTPDRPFAGEALGAFVAASRWAEIGPALRHEAERSLLNFFGCALGAAAALMLDWMPIRAALDTAAARLGVTPPPFGMPGEEAVAETLSLLSPRERLDRSLAFGARQVLQHHHGLLDLLETRAGARAG